MSIRSEIHELYVDFSSYPYLRTYTATICLQPGLFIISNIRISKLRKKLCRSIRLDWQGLSLHVTWKSSGYEYEDCSSNHFTLFILEALLPLLRPSPHHLSFHPHFLSSYRPSALPTWPSRQLIWSGSFPSWMVGFLSSDLLLLLSRIQSTSLHSHSL